MDFDDCVFRNAQLQFSDGDSRGILTIDFSRNAISDFLLLLLHGGINGTYVIAPTTKITAVTMIAPKNGRIISFDFNQMTILDCQSLIGLITKVWEASSNNRFSKGISSAEKYS